MFLLLSLCSLGVTLLSFYFVIMFRRIFHMFLSDWKYQFPCYTDFTSCVQVLSILFSVFIDRITYLSLQIFPSSMKSYMNYLNASNFIEHIIRYINNVYMFIIYNRPDIGILNWVWMFFFTLLQFYASLYSTIYFFSNIIQSTFHLMLF